MLSQRIEVPAKQTPHEITPEVTENIAENIRQATGQTVEIVVTSGMG